MRGDADREKPCGARLPGAASRRCVLPAGHAGSHRYALVPAEPGAPGPGARLQGWRRTKACPECGARVMVAARVCGVCGKRFDGRSAARAVAREDPRVSRAAVAAMGCSLVGVWVVSIPLGLYARRVVSGSAGRLTGRGLGTIAVGLGVIDMIATGLLVGLLA